MDGLGNGAETAMASKILWPQSKDVFRLAQTVCSIRLQGHDSYALHRCLLRV